MQMWRYEIPSIKGEGWAILFLDNEGCFAVLSDWGDWSYRWSARGGATKDMRYFIVTCNNDSLLRKLNPVQEFDAEATLTAVKEYISSMRQEGRLTEQEEQEELRLLEEHEGLDNEWYWDRWLGDTDMVHAYELRVDRYPLAIQAFLEKCWPRLREEIQKEILAAP